MRKSAPEAQLTPRNGLDSLESSHLANRCLLSICCVPDESGHWDALMSPTLTELAHRQKKKEKIILDSAKYKEEN